MDPLKDGKRLILNKWIKRLSALKSQKKVVILEGQFNPQFAVDACKKYHISHYILILIHADQKTREHRLISNRNQPDLANADMNQWAEFLNRKIHELKGRVIDTSNSDVQSNLDEIINIIKEHLNLRSRDPYLFLNAISTTPLGSN